MGNCLSVVSPVVVDSLDLSAATDKLPWNNNTKGDMSDNKQEGSRSSSGNNKVTKIAMSKNESSLAGIKGKKKKQWKGQIMEEVMRKAIKLSQIL